MNGQPLKSSVLLMLILHHLFAMMDFLIIKLSNVFKLIHSFNVLSRWGTQTPFKSLTFDWVCPDDLKNSIPLIGGVEANFTHGELQKEMDMLNRAYIEVMKEGDSKGRVFTFPISIYNITKDFPWESENAL